jgi:uncharacterized membrane protein
MSSIQISLFVIGIICIIVVVLLRNKVSAVKVNKQTSAVLWLLAAVAAIVAAINITAQ